MLRIVVDTNAFVRDFRLEGTAFRILRGGLARAAGLSLVIPEVVLDETATKYAQKIGELSAEIESVERDLRRYLGTSEPFIAGKPDVTVERTKYES